MRGNSAQRVSTGHLDRKLVCPVVIWHKAPACLCAPPSTLARSAWPSHRHTQECSRSAPPAACTPAVRHSSRTAGSWSRLRRGRSASSAASPGLGAAHRAAHPRLPRTGPERATSVHRPVASQVSIAHAMHERACARKRCKPMRQATGAQVRGGARAERHAPGKCWHCGVLVLCRSVQSASAEASTQIAWPVLPASENYLVGDLATGLFS